MRRMIASLLFLHSISVFAATCPAERWEMADTQQDGWKLHKLEEAKQIASTLNTTAFVVAHKGKIVLEYGRPSSSIRINSSRKSILSILYGIAYDKGQVNLNATLGELGIDDRSPLSDLEKTATVQNLLSARSCVFHEAAAETAAMKAERPARGSCKPGEQWYYNNWDFNALGAIYKIFTGNDVYEGLKAELAVPLQFENFTKFLDTNFQYEFASQYPAYHMNISARDLARIGVLMSRGGDWCGKQIVSRKWVEESIAPISPVPKNPGVEYGYMWWTSSKNVHFGNKFNGKVFSARGNLGQFLLVDIANDLVVAHLVESNSESKQVNNSEFGKVLRPILQAIPHQM